MKLKVYNQANSRHVAPRRVCTVRINTKNGGISFSASCATTLGMDKWKGLVIIQDEDRPTDWYIAQSDENEAFLIRGKKGASVIVQSIPLAKHILSSCKIESHSVRFLLSSEPVIEGKIKLYAIITKSASDIISKERRLAS